MRGILATALVAATASLIAASAIAQTINIKLAHGSPRGHPNYTHAEMLAAEIEKVTNGRVKVTVFGDRQLGDDRDIIQIVRTGTADAGYASSVNFPLILKKVSYDALQLPGLVKSYDDLGKVLVSPAAIKLLEFARSPTGSKGLAFSEGGQRHFLNRNGPTPQGRGLQGPEDPHRSDRAAQGDVGARRHQPGRHSLWRGLYLDADASDRCGRVQHLLDLRRQGL